MIWCVLWSGFMEVSNGVCSFEHFYVLCLCIFSYMSECLTLSENFIVNLTQITGIDV